MKSIQTLIKLNKQKLDEKRRELAELSTQKDQLLEYSRLMHEELRIEMEFAAREPEMSMTFSGYKKMILGRQENITVAVRDLDKRSAILTDEISDIYSEVKKYEIVLQQKIAAEEKERKSKEEKNLNEIALNNFLKSEG
jgi:flagellar FliJ protein